MLKQIAKTKRIIKKAAGLKVSRHPLPFGRDLAKAKIKWNNCGAVNSCCSPGPLHLRAACGPKRQSHHEGGGTKIELFQV